MAHLTGHLFLSTLSLRRATVCTCCRVHLPVISIHALLAESDLGRRVVPFQAGKISIHALLAESDRWPPLLPKPLWAISIHALLAESDGAKRAPSPVNVLFLSTLSLRRATAMTIAHPACRLSFLSTLSLRRATFCGCCARFRCWISIHALLAESDFLPISRGFIGG